MSNKLENELSCLITELGCKAIDWEDFLSNDEENKEEKKSLIDIETYKIQDKIVAKTRAILSIKKTLLLKD
jgi:hypothetical protein